MIGDKYMAPRRQHDDSGSSEEIMDTCEREALHQRQIELAPSLLKPLLSSDNIAIQGLGAVMAATHDVATTGAHRILSSIRNKGELNG